METEKPLSEKMDNHDSLMHFKEYHIFWKKDVAQAVERLKKRFNEDDDRRIKEYTFEDQMIYAEDLFGIIDEIFGDLK